MAKYVPLIIGINYVNRTKETIFQKDNSSVDEKHVSTKKIGRMIKSTYLIVFSKYWKKNGKNNRSPYYFPFENIDNSINCIFTALENIMIALPSPWLSLLITRLGMLKNKNFYLTCWRKCQCSGGGVCVRPCPWRRPWRPSWSASWCSQWNLKPFRIT